MPTTKYSFIEDDPGINPGMYITCRTNPKYYSPRWWDGDLWWDVAVSKSRSGSDRLFSWPKGAAANGVKCPEWMRGRELCLRAITEQKQIRFGVPYPHFSEAEVLNWLVEKGVLPVGWKNSFQNYMRDGVDPPKDVDRTEWLPRGYDEYVAIRLRNTCRHLGITNQVPDDNARLFEGAFTVLGIINGELDKLKKAGKIP